MKTWANLKFLNDVMGERVFYVTKVMNAEVRPEDVSAGVGEGWRECPHDVKTGWISLAGQYFNSVYSGRIVRNGLSILPKQRRIVEFRVFSFFGMDNFRVCNVKVDIDNYTPDDVARFVLSFYKGKVDLGITSGAGDPKGAKRYFQSIDRMVYTNFSSVENIDKMLRQGGTNRKRYRELLWAAVTPASTLVKVPDDQKVPLLDKSKLISEYNLDPAFPIIADWGLDAAARWSPDLADIGFDFLMDFVIEVVDAIV